MTENKVDLVSVTVTTEEDGPILEAEVISATIRGPREAVLHLLDEMVEATDTDILGGSTEDADGNITPIIPDTFPKGWH